MEQSKSFAGINYHYELYRPIQEYISFIVYLGISHKLYSSFKSFSSERNNCDRGFYP